jgi:hypothetical protein
MNQEKFPQITPPALEGALLGREELDPIFVRRMSELPDIIRDFYINGLQNKEADKILYGSTEKKVAYFLAKTNKELVDMFIRVNPEYKGVLEQMREIDEMDKNTGPKTTQPKRDPFYDAKDITPTQETPLIPTNKRNLPGSHIE